MIARARFFGLLGAVVALALVLPSFAGAQPLNLPESAAAWLAAWQADSRNDAVDRRALRAAEARVFDFIERGTGRLIAEPDTAAEQAAVGRHLTLLDEVLAEPILIEHVDGSVSMNHGLHFANGQIPISGPNGQVELRCVSVREHLLGRTDPARFPGFLKREFQQ